MTRGMNRRLSVGLGVCLAVMVAVLDGRLAWAEEQSPRVIELTATADSRFVPDVITVSPGERVIFRIRAERNSQGPSWSRNLHGFQILDGQAILLKKTLKTTGQKGTAEWNHGVTDITWTEPQRASEYQLMCHRPCGRAHDGMTGKILVKKLSVQAPEATVMTAATAVQ